MTIQSNQPIQRIVIVGGGSAGWITAGLIAADHGPDSGVSVTLVESPQVATVGVGEGTWPTMRTTLQRIGLSESEFLTACSAAFKQGTQFIDWVDGGAEDRYYHPFTAPAGYGQINLAAHWLSQRDKVSFVDAVTVQGHLCDRGLAPKQDSTPEYAAVANYAYHLDAGRFAALLQQHCTARLGVRHVLDHVTGINGQPDGDIESIATGQHGDIEGDLFIDCTGFAAMLLGRHYGVPWLDRRDVLFNDAALAVQVPYPEADSPVACQTLSTAQKAGWIWDIGLSSRRGVGHVYSSAHSSDEDAAAALRAYLDRTGAPGHADLEFRKIAFQPGHRERFWHRNCVAVGMSSGFLEPLEASALVLVELSARMISEELPPTREVMDAVCDRFNQRFRYRWDRIIDFLKLHYLLSRRDDSDFWIDNRRPETVPSSLQESVGRWRYHVPWHNDFSQVDEVFSSASYQYVLYGMGFETALRPGARWTREAPRAQALFQDNLRKANQVVKGLPRHRDLLTRIEHQGLPVLNAS